MMCNSIDILTPEDNKKVCIICETKIPECDYERHVTICSEENFENDDVFEVKTDCTKCSFCNNDIPTNSYDNHLSTCLRNFVGDINKPKEKIVDVTCNNLEEKQCTLCEKYVPVAEYDLHAEKCLLKMYDDMDETYSNTKSKDEEVDCLACGKSILKSELGLHLEDCMSLSRVFDDADDPKEGTSKGCDDGGSKYNCPFCMTLVNEADMNAHINVCLDIKDCMTDCGKNRNMFVESLNCDEEF
ncbi:hypothetical protein NQ317_014987 [Molorchus minor]|uniref:TRAF-type domain-containing protein n=1 Tax=Molorchus minor TaxID=1323400 RepID=A0ABQ9J6H5_9CUCU|nr:hypothetical protein NQ317_014987 [Molorchus minor]